MIQYEGDVLTRAMQLIKANQIGSHAAQILMFRKLGKGNASLFHSELGDDALRVLVYQQASLLASDPYAMRAWVQGIPSYFTTADMDALLAAPLKLDVSLPVNVIADDLRRHGASELDAASIATLAQPIFEIERDGKIVPAMIERFACLDLKIYTGQLGDSGTDEQFLQWGRTLESRIGDCPYDTHAVGIQIVGRKLWNWSERRLGIRDEKVLADELLRNPDVQAMLPLIRKLPPQRVAVIGHSFTMGEHWCSPSSFTRIAHAVIRQHNPNVTFTQFNGGSMDGRCSESFLEPVLAYKPDRVLIVIINRDQRDIEGVTRLVQGLQTVAKDIYFFSPLLDNPQFHPVAKSLGVQRLDFHPILETAPDRDRFVCLDGLHTTEPYHMLLARHWLAVLAGHPSARLAR